MIKDLEKKKQEKTMNIKEKDGGYGHGGDSYATIFVPRRGGHGRSLQTFSLSHCV